MQSIWIIYHKVFSDSTDSNNNKKRVKRWIQSLCECFWIFCTFILIFVFVVFCTSFAVLFRNAQLPLMRSKPSTPELYKFHSILLGALPFCKQATGGTETGEWRMAKRMARKTLCDFYLKNTKLILCFFRLHTRVRQWQREWGRMWEGEREEESESAGCHSGWICCGYLLGSILGQTLLFQHMQIATARTTHVVALDVLYFVAAVAVANHLLQFPIRQPKHKVTQ